MSSPWTKWMSFMTHQFVSKAGWLPPSHTYTLDDPFSSVLFPTTKYGLGRPPMRARWPAVTECTLSHSPKMYFSSMVLESPFPSRPPLSLPPLLMPLLLLLRLLLLLLLLLLLPPILLFSINNEFSSVIHSTSTNHAGSLWTYSCTKSEKFLFFPTKQIPADDFLSNTFATFPKRSRAINSITSSAFLNFASGKITLCNAFDGTEAKKYVWSFVSSFARRNSILFNDDDNCSILSSPYSLQISA